MYLILDQGQTLLHLAIVANQHDTAARLLLMMLDNEIVLQTDKCGVFSELFIDLMSETKNGTVTG